MMTLLLNIHGNLNHCDCLSINRQHEEAQQQETRSLIQVSPPPGYSASPPQRIATHTRAAAADREQGHRHTDITMNINIKTSTHTGRYNTFRTVLISLTKTMTKNIR